MALQIFIKQSIQFQQSSGLQGYYSGNNPQSLSFVTGTLPQARQWANYPNYIDITEYVSDPYKVKLTMSAEIDSQGDVISNGGIGAKKSFSGTFSFERLGYSLLRQWLFDDVSAPINTVDVKIYDDACKKYYEGFIITSKSITYCENEVCQFNITLTQKEEALTCIKKTVINDNFQGWFQTSPANGKKHPRFSYCNEQKPQGVLIVVTVLFVILSLLFVIIGFILGTAWNIIAAIINTVIAIINFIKSLGFGGANIDPLPYFSYANFIDALGAYFVELMGCGREHPAPLVRDYISNVCTKCGVRVDNTTAPLFFANQMTFNTSDGNYGQNGDTTVVNPYYNACYFYAPAKRGIRRFANLNIFTGFTSQNNTDYWIEDNRPNLALDQFLDKILPLWNSQWKIESTFNNGQLVPTLYIYRKDFKPLTNYVFDFSPTGADRSKIMQGICYEWNGKKYPVFEEGIYSQDGTDSLGDEALGYANDIVFFGNIDNNPNLDEPLDKRQPFGAANFRLTGSNEDYAFNALQTAMNVASISTAALFFPIFLPMLNSVRNNLSDYGDYALLMKEDKANLPKILIWNGSGYDNAKCIRTYYATANNGAQPQINPPYNGNSHPWDSRHTPNTFVIGSTLTIPQSPYGAYRVTDLTGLFFDFTVPAMLVNYPMYFAQDFKGNLWDYFHWIDDPTRYPKLNQDGYVKIPLCCDDLERIKPFLDGSQVVLGQRVKVSNNYYSDAVITEVTISYDYSDKYGQYIEIKFKM